MEIQWRKDTFDAPRGGLRVCWKLALPIASPRDADLFVNVVQAPDNWGVYIGKRKAGTAPTAEAGKKMVEGILLAFADKVREAFTAG